jgi:hypothetical protein
MDHDGLHQEEHQDSPGVSPEDLEASLIEVMESLPDRFQPRTAGNMRVTIQFEFPDAQPRWWILSIDSGQCRVSRSRISEWDAAVTMKAAEFIGINRGTIPAPSLFWSGRIQIEGDVSAVVGLAPVMGWQ